MDLGIRGRKAIVCASSRGLGKACATALAREGCDVVLATDPDCDRMGCAVRNKDGKMELLTGNQIGAVLADYRLGKYKERGLVPREGSSQVAIIKTFVTTQLQHAMSAME